MTSQFKNPLPGKEPSASQNDAWLSGGPRPVGPNGQPQGNFPPPRPPQAGGPFTPPWQPGAQPMQGRGAPSTGNLTEQQTVKRPSFPGPQQGFNGPKSLPQTPETYVQGQRGRYGPGAPGGQGGPFPNGPQSMPGGPVGPRGFGPPQRPGAPMGPGPRMPGGPASFPPGFNSFNQANLGSAFSQPAMGMMSAPPMPGTFNPNRPMGPGSFGDGPLGPGGRRTDGPIPPGKGPSGKKKKRLPVWARVLIGFLTVLLILGGVGFGYYQINFSGSVSHIVGQTVQRAKGEEDPNANLSGGILTGPRVNILLLGSDTDQKFQGTYLAQTDIVVTIDPASHTVGMLSIPRDFYIPVPGYGLHKLDEAYSLGGIDLSRRTIQQDFGIPINYYAWVGLDGFIKVINEVNGVDVDVLHPIVDDNYPDDTGANANDPYALKRLDLPPGPQHLDGPTALEYVRSRHADLVGDFGRSARQQQVLSALKTKLANPDIFNHLSAIANDLQGSLKTDMQLPDILKLMNFARSLDVNKINKLILGPPYSHSGTSPSGASVVFPDCAQIIPAISQMLQLGNNAACNIQGDSGGPTHLPVAYTVGHASPQAVSSSNTAGLSDMASGGPSDLFGMQSLMDLMLMGVFESPNVF